MPQRFSAKIHKLDLNPCVDVPKRVSQAFGVQGYVPVKGTLNGRRIRASLVPTGDGRHRLFINGDMRKRAGVDAGDRIHLVLTRDTEPRTAPMPKEFALVLKQASQGCLWTAAAVTIKRDSGLLELGEAPADAETEY